MFRTITACLGAAVLFSGAGADDFVDRVNAAYSSIEDDRRSDLVLLPLLAEMTAPPPEVAKVVDAALRTPRGSAWGRISAWATAPEQQALIDAIDRVTKEEDYRRAYAFGQPYGVEGIPTDLVRAGLYTELGDPPMLAGAQIGYFGGLNNLARLMHVEATRRQAEGDPAGAIDLLIDWVFFSRQLADRTMVVEAAWGYRQMAFGLERVRDIVRVDDTGEQRLTPEDIAAINERLDPRRGYIDLSRATLPQGDRAAGEQLIERVLARGGGVNRGVFAPTLAKLNAGDRPLRLFGEASSWDGAANSHASYSQSMSSLRSIYGDWEARWSAPPHSSIFTQPIEALNVLKDPDLAVLSAAYARVTPTYLLQARELVETELVGTRQALAIVGYTREHSAFPRVIESVRPRFIRELAPDPYNPNRARGQKPPLQYFVPERDTSGSHEILLITSNVPQYPTFRKPLFREDFVLYSFGADNSKDWAREVENRFDAGSGRDYLIWPPVISLSREHLVDQGALE